MTQSSIERSRDGRGSDKHPENALKSPEGRVPPHDLDAEAAVLSACFMRSVEAFDEASVDVSAAEFYSEAHRRIFESMTDLAGKGQPIDVVAVAGDLKDKQRLAQIGGMPYLGQILDAAPVVSTGHLKAFARRVREKARLRTLAYRLAVAQARCYGPLAGEEAETFFSDVEREIGDICAARHTTDLVHSAQIVREVNADLHARAKNGGELAGIDTGFPRLNRALGGLHGGDVTIVAGRPGMGKTSLVVGIGDNVAWLGHPFAFFSLEMPGKQVTQRRICSRGRVDLSKLRSGALTPSEWQRYTQASSEVHDLDFHVDDGGAQTLAMIRSKCRRFVNRCAREKKKKPVIGLDYLQLMRTRESRSDTRATLVGELSKGLKALAKELDVPIIALSQLNRGVETRPEKRPVMSDLRESGDIEQDADNIVFIYRDDYYFEDSAEPNVAELLIVKQRNGATGVVKVRFDKHWTRFDNLAEGEYEDDRPTTDGAPYDRGEFYKSPPEET